MTERKDISDTLNKGSYTLKLDKKFKVLVIDDLCGGGGGGAVLKSHTNEHTYGSGGGSASSIRGFVINVDGLDEFYIDVGEGGKHDYPGTNSVVRCDNVVLIAGGGGAGDKGADYLGGGCQVHIDGKLKYNHPGVNGTKVEGSDSVIVEKKHTDVGSYITAKSKYSKVLFVSGAGGGCYNGIPVNVAYKGGDCGENHKGGAPSHKRGGGGGASNYSNGSTDRGNAPTLVKVGCGGAGNVYNLDVWGGDGQCKFTAYYQY